MAMAEASSPTVKRRSIVKDAILRMMPSMLWVVTQGCYAASGAQPTASAKWVPTACSAFSGADPVAKP